MPDDSELIKAGTEGLVEGTLKSFHELMLRFLGPAADEGGVLLREIARHYHKRAVRFLSITDSKLYEAKIEPQPVPLKLLKPIVENASLEDDDALQDIWANLLANAADPRPSAHKVLPSFPAILKELTSVDVKFLNQFYVRFEELRLPESVPPRLAIDRLNFTIEELLPVYAASGLARVFWRAPITMEVQKAYEEELADDLNAVSQILAVLMRQGLVDKSVSEAAMYVNGEGEPARKSYRLTALALMLVEACTTPQG
jgi:hypothetical protein